MTIERQYIRQLNESYNKLPLNQTIEFAKPYFICYYSGKFELDKETQQLLDREYAKIYPNNKICYRKGQKVIIELINEKLDKVKVTFLTSDGKKDMSIIEYFDDLDADFFKVNKSEENNRSLVPLVKTILSNIRGLMTQDIWADENDGYLINIPLISGSNVSKIKEQVIKRLKSSKLSGTLSQTGMCLILRIQKR